MTQPEPPPKWTDLQELAKKVENDARNVWGHWEVYFIAAGALIVGFFAGHLMR